MSMSNASLKTWNVKCAKTHTFEHLHDVKSRKFHTNVEVTVKNTAAPKILYKITDYMDNAYIKQKGILCLNWCLTPETFLYVYTNIPNMKYFWSQALKKKRNTQSILTNQIVILQINPVAAGQSNRSTMLGKHRGQLTSFCCSTQKSTSSSHSCNKMKQRAHKQSWYLVLIFQGFILQLHRH